MSDIERSLVSVRRIVDIRPIPNADAIEVAQVDDWSLVVKKGEFKVGDLCAYFEIDSFLPETDPRYAFLMKSSVREFEGVRGHRLRTIKLRGQISQGLALPIGQFVNDFDGSKFDEGQELSEFFTPGTDLTELLGIKKYEKPLSANLAGKVKGYFPSFIRRTDQERCQNLGKTIFGYEDSVIETNVSPDLVADAIAAGRLTLVDGKVFRIDKAKASPLDTYEVSIKLDGSSATFFHKDGELGVCSRNLQLKHDDEDNQGNSFVRVFYDSGLAAVFSLVGNVAIQGELMGPNIQGNRENLKDFRFFMFDAQNLDTGKYLTPDERVDLFNTLLEAGVKPELFVHVPVLKHSVTLPELGITDVAGLLAFAEGPSIVHPIREGLVFKRSDGEFSFKAISNKFLEKEKD